MKNSSDPRHQNRAQIIQELFAYTFAKKTIPNKNDITCSVIRCLAQIDPLITEAAPAFPLKNIAKVDVSILRLAVYEMLIEKKQPVKVIIDEAVELAKEYGGETSPSFVNGVLGFILKKQNYADNSR